MNLQTGKTLLDQKIISCFSVSNRAGISRSDSHIYNKKFGFENKLAWEIDTRNDKKFIQFSINGKKRQKIIWPWKTLLDNFLSLFVFLHKKSWTGRFDFTDARFGFSTFDPSSKCRCKIIIDEFFVL